NDIPTLEEKKKLLLYKRYYVSNVEVKEADPKYLVGDYPFSWTLTKRHLIEEVKEPLPPQFSCHIEIQKYKNLFRFAETENLQNLSLTTRLPSAILINPPMREAATLKQWYVDQKDVHNSFVTKEAFKDPLVVLPPPNEKDIISIQEALATLKVNKYAWVRGVASLSINKKSLWFNCQKEIGAPINWDINCTLCGEDSKVVARCRFVITIKDETVVVEAMITGIEAEQLLPFTWEEMSIAEAENKKLFLRLLPSFTRTQLLVSSDITRQHIPSSLLTAQEEEQVSLSQTMQSEESTRAKIVNKDATNPTQQHQSSPAKKLKDQD
ncbi:60 kDa chaperonin 2, partial [Striga asiatica]